MIPTYEQVKNAPEIRAYINQADASLAALGFTEHAFPHVTRCAVVASTLLTQLGYPPREAELAQIAGFLHDIGNAVNRSDHAQSGALMAMYLLDKMGMPAEEVAAVVNAIGHHDEKTASPVSAITAALLLADKSDVRRSRVRCRETIMSDIHDRVNYAVESSRLDLDTEARTVTLRLDINTEVCPVMEYFEIFLGRMMLCKRAAEFLDLAFKLNINGAALL